MLRAERRGPTVSVLAYEGMSVFEVGIVTEIFGLPRPEFDFPWYDLTICAETPGPVRVVGGATLHTGHGLEAFAAADTLIVPGVPDVHADPSPSLVAALLGAHRRGARILSICSGAFALAGAGLLDGRHATTHWRYAETLRRRYPAVALNPDVLYLTADPAPAATGTSAPAGTAAPAAPTPGGPVLTSAGSAAGLDLCLHVIRLDHGPTVANAVARRLVVQPHRDGGQAQFVEAPVPADPDDDRVARSMEWALSHLSESISADALARQAHMSTRTYLRHFTRATGTTPIRWLIAQRVQASLPLLEGTTAPIEEVATTVGFDTAVTYRHHFTQTMQTSPSAYRKAFHRPT